MNPQDYDRAHEAYQCVDPEAGSALLYAYGADALNAAERLTFEDHLCFCLKCQEDLDWLRGLLRLLKTSPPVSLQETLRDLVQQGVVSTQEPEFFFEVYTRLPLPVTAIEDLNQTNLMLEYQETPLIERLAAATGTSDLAFPLTVTYLKGEIIAQFRRRAGQLFFRLQSSISAEQPIACVLQYPSPADPAALASLIVRAGEEKRLGPFQAFVPSNTMQEMLAAIKRFELRFAPHENTV